MILHSGTYELDDVTTDNYLDHINDVLNVVPNMPCSNATRVCLSQVLKKTIFILKIDSSVYFDNILSI